LGANAIANRNVLALIRTGAVLSELEALDGTGVEQAARVTAFLNVELFRALYDQFKGHALPPRPAIERQIEQFGVSPKQKERARQTFMGSAQYAGFIDASSGRFVKPGIPQKEDVAPQQEDRGSGGSDGSGGELVLDPLLIALLKKVPSADGPPHSASAGFGPLR
jgi:hypothetical protein